MRSEYYEAVEQKSALQISRLISGERFVGKTEKFVFNVFIDLSQCRDMRIGVA